VSDPRARLTSALRPVVEAVGADLEDLSVTPAGRRRVVRVVVDRDGGISLDGVADVSRVLSEALDDLDAREPELLAGAYVLEVSSPGVDRPLTAARHWRRNVGRLVTATLRDGGSATGRVLRVDGEQAVALDVDGTERLLPLADVVKGVVQVEFARPGGSDEVDDTEADDLEADDDADDIEVEADEAHAAELLAAEDDPDEPDEHDEEAP
jgi:ribosome maturation factor RimP